MSKQSVIGVYDSFSDATAAVRELDRNRFPIQQTSIIAQDLQNEKEIHGYITAGDLARNGAGMGAWVGGIFGLLIGAAFVWVPGFGPLLIAGPLAAALLGGMEGALAGAAGGGALAALAGWDVSRKHILKYEERLRGGKHLVVAHGSDHEITWASDILRNTRVSELNVHTDQGPDQTDAKRSLQPALLSE